MESKIGSSLAASRGRHGVLILIAASLTLAIAHVIAFSGHELDLNVPINLPIPDLLRQLKPEPLRETQTLFNTSTFLSAGSCNVEHINGTHFDKSAEIAPDQNIAIDGWLVDGNKKNVATMSWIELLSTDSIHDYATPIRFRVRRADVQDYLGGRTAYAMAGFMSTIETNNLADGDYHMLVVYKSGNSFYRCDVGRHVLIQGSAPRPEAKTL